MKTKDLVKQYPGMDLTDFESFLRRSSEYKSHFNDAFLGGSLDDSVCAGAIDDYKLYKTDIKKYYAKEAELAAKKAQVKAEKQAQAELEAEERRKAISTILITSGFNFDGYTIKKYSGYISGDDAISVDRGMAIFGSGTNVKEELLNSLVKIRRNAIQELKEAAYDLGCNAVIGVDFDYITLDPQTANLKGGTTYQPYVFCVTANGNAVIIEKNA